MREPRPENAASDDSKSADTRERALARIAVRPPYFGLGAMEHRGDGVVAALVPASPPVAPERGAVEAAQVARHLAILGSCAAALSRDDDQPHHYLATKAHFARLSGGPDAVQGGILEAEAVASWIDRRNARALVKLITTDGHGLHLLDVHYSVLTPKMFTRLHPPVELTADDAVAGAGTDVGEIVTLDREGIEVDGGIIPAGACAGHFPGYPAAPVAIVMGRLCRAAGLALSARLDAEIAYQIEEGHVVASRLARAGQRLALAASYERPISGGHLLRGTATADGEVVGEVSVTMSVTEASDRVLVTPVGH
ncbi:MAG: hypothetical protein ACR2QO_00635 [Acidimicrobiales bacterium]